MNAFNTFFNLQRFADNVVDSLNKTTSAGLSEEMKTYYSDYIIDNAEPELVHAQFGQKRTIPKNGGKTIEFRKYKPYDAAGKLTEGVTPVGNTLNVSVVEATLDQYGAYTAVTDVVDLTAIDNNLLEASKLHGAQAGLTLDGVVREVINGGTNKYYAGGVSGRVTPGISNLTVADIKMAVRMLKRMNAPKIKGDYVAIIHPDCAHDLTSDPAWIEAHKYASPEEIYTGEIGKIAGVRFIESSEAKIFFGQGPSKDDTHMAENNLNCDIYSTLIIGDNAYGSVDVAGGNLKHIFKGFGSGGTADPLDQRAPTGWKAMQTAVRLVEENMVRIESLASK